MPKEDASVGCHAIPWVGGVLPLALGSGLHDLGRSNAGQPCEDEGTSLGQVPGPCRHVYETDRCRDGARDTWTSLGQVPLPGFCECVGALGL